MKARLALALLMALSLGACATVQRYDAAGDIHAFLVSIRDGDQAAFEAHVDRPALKAQLRGRILEAALQRQDAQGWGVALGMVLVGSLVDLAVDRTLQPDVFLAVAEANGYVPSKPLPGRAALAAAIRPLEADRVCVTTKRDGPCVLIFRNEANVWKLTAFEGDPRLLKPR